MLFSYTSESICSLRLVLWTASSLFPPPIMTQGLLKQSLFLTIDKVICNVICATAMDVTSITPTLELKELRSHC